MDTIGYHFAALLEGCWGHGWKWTQRREVSPVTNSCQAVRSQQVASVPNTLTSRDKENGLCFQKSI